LEHEELGPRKHASRTQLLTRTCLRVFCILLFLAAIYLLFFYRLADRDLWSSHEARAAMDAQIILDEGAWGLPHLYDGRLELQKPPLYYWLVAAIAFMHGGTVDAWAVRLPAALSAAGCVIGIFAMAWRRGRSVAGLIAATVLGTAIHFTWLARVGRIDMPLTFLVSIMLIGIYEFLFSAHANPGDAQPKASTALIALLAVVAGAGFLLKGPIAWTLPTAAVGLWLLLEWRLPAPWQLGCWWSLARGLGLWWSVPLALVTPAIWVLWANQQTHGDFFRTFFLHHNLERALGENVVDRWSHPWWLYGPLFLANFLPWSVLVPVAGWLAWRRGWWREDAEARFGAAWFLAMFLVLSCVSFKRADYLLPAYPGVALFLGCVGERSFQTLARPRRAVAIFAGVATACLVGWVVYLNLWMPVRDRELEARRFAAEVRKAAPAPTPVVFFRMEAHALAFHVGRPLAIFVEWEKLSARAAQPEPQYVVMPLAQFQQCAAFAPAAKFETLLASTELPGCNFPKPLVLLRTLPPVIEARAAESVDARTANPATDRHAAAQHSSPGQ
jgi:4-amino-4-deoxy-L-arabinose transferase-like glycosyltransferase